MALRFTLIGLMPYDHDVVDKACKAGDGLGQVNTATPKGGSLSAGEFHFFGFPTGFHSSIARCDTTITID